MRIAVLCFVVPVFLFIESCTIATEVEIFNNTGTPIKLVTEDAVVLVEPGRSTKFFEREFGRLEIELAGARQRYEVESLIPESFISWHGWSWWQSKRARAQLEPDGKIWLVGVEQNLPAVSFTEQPKGFPLVPRAA